MFVVITTQATKRGLLTRAKERITGKNILIHRKCFLGNHYYHIVVCGEAVPWERIAAIAGRASSRLVAPPEMEIPYTRGLGRYQPSIFEGRLTAVAAVQALGENPLPAKSRTVGLIDEDGLWGWCCRELAPLAGVVRVYTRRRERYEELARELMESQGASVVLADTLEELADCAFALSPSPTGVQKLSIPVITVSRSGIQGRPTVNRLTLRLPDEILDEIPPGITPEDLLGAAYEQGTRKFPLDYPIAECRVDGRRADIGELTRLRGCFYQ